MIIEYESKRPRVGQDVFIAPTAVIIGDVGMGAVVLHAAVIGRQAMVAAGGVITPGTIIPPRTLAAGSPAAVKKDLSGAALASVEHSAKIYHELSASYLKQRLDHPALVKAE